jgi:hypothetical protein
VAITPIFAVVKDMEKILHEKIFLALEMICVCPFKLLLD